MQYNVKSDRKKVFNLLKFIGGVVIFYFGLKLCISPIIEEDFVSKNMYEGLEKSISDSIDDDFKLEIGGHEAPTLNEEEVFIQENEREEQYKIKFDNICGSNSTFCDKIIFNGSYSSKDKYIYLASVVYILKFIDDNIQIGLPIKKQLGNVIVNPSANSRRGFANWTNITLNLGSVRSYVEFMELMTHELGHIVDLGVVRGYSTVKDEVFTEFGESVFMQDDPSISYYQLSWQNETIRKNTAVIADFCSSYAMTDPFEDFAECHNLYLNHNVIFRAWAQNNDIMRQKYNFFANLYGGKYLFDTSSDLVKYDANSSVRPWDTTKM